MAQLTISGADIHFSDVGSGTPVFLFVHGWGCNRACWDGQLSDLSANNRCIAVDLRGCGESSAVPPYGVGRALEDLAQLIRELHLPPVILVGHSLGGINALALNGRYPELVQGIVTIDSPINADTGAGSPRSVARIREAGSMSAVEGYIRSFNRDPPNPLTSAYIEKVLLTCPADVGAGMLEDLHLVGQDMPRLIHEADKKPFMAIWAENPLGDPAWLREKTLFLRQEPVPGTGHFVMMEQPAVTNALLRAFLDDAARDPRVSVESTPS
ncbi:MAG: alpha/beta fold hydrolase [Dehalococcoidia bacterium]